MFKGAVFFRARCILYAQIRQFVELLSVQQHRLRILWVQLSKCKCECGFFNYHRAASAW